MVTHLDYLVLNADGVAVAEEYATYGEALAHGMRIGGYVTDCEYGVDDDADTMVG